MEQENFNDWGRKTQGSAESAALNPAGYLRMWEPSNGSPSPRPFQASGSDHALSELPYEGRCRSVEVGGNSGSVDPLGLAFDGSGVLELQEDVHEGTPEADHLLQIVRESAGMEEPFWWDEEPEGIPRVIEAQPNRVDRLAAIGNGQVPQCAALAWRTLKRRKDGMN
jgi:hypothetical protein